jgi:hypothetical protein
MRTPVSFENNGRVKPQRKMRDCEWTLLHANAEQPEQDFTTPTTPSASLAATWKQTLRLRGLKPTAKIGRGSATTWSPASVPHANGTVHRAAVNDFPFQNRAARGSVCNGLFCLRYAFESILESSRSIIS